MLGGDGLGVGLKRVGRGREGKGRLRGLCRVWEEGVWISGFCFFGGMIGWFGSLGWVLIGLMDLK